MIRRLFVEKKAEYAAQAKGLREELERYLGVEPEGVRVLVRYDVENLSDETYAKAIATVDSDAQTALFKQCETILTEQAANVYLQDLADFVALNPAFEGYEFYPLYAMDFSKIRPAK